MCVRRSPGLVDVSRINLSSIAIDTQLADRTAHTSNAGNKAPASGTVEAPGSGIHSPALDPRKRPSNAPESSPQDLLSGTRAELSEAQRSRSELQDRLTRTIGELEKLQKSSTQNARRIGALQNEVTHLQMRLKDRDEELKGKAKLLEVGCTRCRWPSCISLIGFTILGLPR